VNWAKVGLDFANNVQWTPEQWLRLTLVQHLAMIYLGKDEGIPCHSLAELAELERERELSLSPEAQLSRAEELCGRRYGR
jgi:hypothetical protein